MINYQTFEEAVVQARYIGLIRVGSVAEAMFEIPAGVSSCGRIVTAEAIESVIGDEAEIRFLVRGRSDEIEPGREYLVFAEQNIEREEATGETAEESAFWRCVADAAALTVRTTPQALMTIEKQDVPEGGEYVVRIDRVSVLTSGVRIPNVIVKPGHVLIPWAEARAAIVRESELVGARDSVRCEASRSPEIPGR